MTAIIYFMQKMSSLFLSKMAKISGYVFYAEKNGNAG